MAGVIERYSEEDDEAAGETEFELALRAGRYEDALGMAERAAEDPGTPGWLRTSRLEHLGLALAHAGRYEDAIAAFERALELGWDVVPDGRCEIARVLLLAGRHAEADALWRELREADPGGLWTLNAGGLAYHEVERDEEAAEWLADGLRVALDRDDPAHVVDQMSDARRLSLRRLGRDLDELEREVEVFRVGLAEREQQRASELRVAARRAGMPVRGRTATVAWLREGDDRDVRQRWPAWIDGLVRDEL